MKNVEFHKKKSMLFACFTRGNQCYSHVAKKYDMGLRPPRPPLQ